MTGRGVGVGTIMMYDNDRGGGLKGMNIMAKSKQKTHKKGEVFAWKYNNSTITM